MRSQVENVLVVTMPPVSASTSSVVWNETIDHSKWALTADLSTLGGCFSPNGADDSKCALLRFLSGARVRALAGATSPSAWVCVGDINREYTQYKRPGGQLCIPHDDVHRAYLQSVTTAEKCSSAKRPFGYNYKHLL